MLEAVHEDWGVCHTSFFLCVPTGGRALPTQAPGKTELPYDLENPLLDINLEKNP